MIPNRRMDESSYTIHSSMECGREKVQGFQYLEPQEDVETYFIYFETQHDYLFFREDKPAQTFSPSP